MLKSSTRLNKTIRTGIVAKAVELSGVLEEIKELDAERCKLANAVREKALADAGLTDTMIESMDKAYSTFIHVNKVAYIVFIGQGEYHRINYSVDATVELYSPANRHQLTDPELCQRFKHIRAREVKCNARMTSIRETVMRTVASVATVGQLLKVWPEAESLLPASTLPEPGTGLALDVKTLNALVGLPK